MVISKVKVKKIFNSNGVQISVMTLNLIDELIAKQVYKMVRRCKDGNIKRLTPDLFYIARGLNKDNR